ncbi:hypothetical protein AVEN_173207-1 [Araneus ventricosus]|uniref:Uncharacterized protein n=1 Tax=Araneus ventricosus TaxID=182803 RepID=A0A4Y2JH89_ARAVE|nr:hypothetical protein AVEN_173207-1 [Araneus ventricosus]
MALKLNNVICEYATLTINLYSGLFVSRDFAIQTLHSSTLSERGIEDGLVNGAIGILRHIELNIDEEEEESESNKTKLVRLWIEFPSKDMGNLAKVKSRPHVIAKFHNINGSSMWTPVHLRTATININGAVKCSSQWLQTVRLLFTSLREPTYDEIIYDYNKSQHNQLVYVGLSRVETLEGLYLSCSVIRYAKK